MKGKFYIHAALFFSFMQFFSAGLFAKVAPTVPASNVSYNFIEGTSLRVNWTNGNGAQRIIIARMGSPVTAVPVNGTDYTANSVFGSGFQIAPGQFVVGKTFSFNVDVSGLQPNTIYHFAIFEFNGTGASTEYLMTGTFSSQSTAITPSVPASNVTFTNIIGNSMRVNWTNGNGSLRVVVMKAGSPVNVNPVDLTVYTGGPFGFGSQIGATSGSYVVYAGGGNNTTVTNLDPSTTYHVAIFEANGFAAPVYLTTTPATGNAATLATPTVPASGLSLNFLETTSLRINWTAGNGTRRIVVARVGNPVDAIPTNGVDYLAGTNAPFNTAPEISPGQKVVYDNNSAFNADVTGLSPGTTYHFRVYEYDGTGSNIGYLTSSFGSISGSTLGAPTVAASNLTFTNVTATSMQLQWTNGNGNTRIVLAKAGSPVDAVPSNLTTYSANSFFGNGTQIGSGNYVVHTGAGNGVTVSNLTVGITYYFAVFEANGTNAPVFLTVNPATGSQTTSSRPTIPSSNLTFSSIDGGSMRLIWTSGNGARRIIVARAGSTVTAVPSDGVDYLPATEAPFNIAPEISAGQKVVYDNTGFFADITGLSANTVYHFRIYEYDGTGALIKYLTTSFASGNASTLSTPTVQASAITVTNITNNSMQVNWTNGNGAGRIVLVKQGSAVDSNPVDLTNYVYNTNFGSGAQIGTGNYVVLKDNQSSLVITSLTPGTTYHIAVYEYNGSGTPVYLTVNPARASAGTAAQPTIPSSSLSFSSFEGNAMRLSWNAGNGARRIIIARAGSAVDAVPANNVDYLAGTSAPFNTAPEITPGQKVIFDNNTSSHDIIGLTPNTVYHFRIYEYDVNGAVISYLTSSFASGNASTRNDPTIQASGLQFTAVTATSATVSWTNGNGQGRIVVARQGAAVNSDPADLTNYLYNTNFGVGNQIGTGNYVVYKDNQNSVNITSLTAGTTYHIAVYEYNGSAAPMYLTPGVTGQVTTVGPPTVPASNAGSSNVTGTSAQLNWVNGSGNRRIVLMKQGGPVNAVPANNVHYFANTFFGSGQQIGTGNYVVYDGTQNSVTITSLLANNAYFFAVFEYNDFGATTQVLTSNPAIGNINTSVLPVTLVNFKAVADKERVKISWTTEQEHNSDYFGIERSSNGIDFTEIGRVKAKGESGNRVNYVYMDGSPFNGNNYYRLAQVDKDGRRKHSTVALVSFTTTQLVRKMRNPVNNQLQIELYKQPGSNDYLIIYDMNGRVIKRAALHSTFINTDVSDLLPGVYVLEIHILEKTERIKFVKQ